MDAVVIASHDPTHAGLILACFEVGKPVLCEKPPAPPQWNAAPWWLLGSPITEVSWQAGRPTHRTPEGLHDPAFMLLRTANGVLTTLELFLNAQYGYSTQCEVAAEPGSASLTEPALLSVNADLNCSADYPEDWRPRFAEEHRIELQAWVGALAAGKASPPGTVLPVNFS